MPAVVFYTERRDAEEEMVFPMLALSAVLMPHPVHPCLDFYMFFPLELEPVFHFTSASIDSQ